MSEETQEGGLSGLKKTLLGVAGTAVTGFGIWATTNINKIFGIEDEAVKTEQVVEQAQAVSAQPAPIVLNIENNNTQQQNNSGGGTTIIKETVREVPVAQPAAAPVEEKKETTAERIARLKKEKADRDGASN